MDVREKGNITEAKVVSKLTELGFSVFTPFSDGEKIDLVVEKEGNLYPLQVKTGRKISNGKKIKFNTSNTSYQGDGVKEETYEEYVDFFVVYEPSDEIFLWIPVDEAPSSAMEIRIEESSIDHPNINWYEDYLLDRKI